MDRHDPVAKRRFMDTYSVMRDLLTCIYYKPKVLLWAWQQGYAGCAAMVEIEYGVPEHDNKWWNDNGDFMAGLEFPPTGVTLDNYISLYKHEENEARDNRLETKGYTKR